MNRRYLAIVLFLICVAGGAAIWKIATSHKARSAEADYSFDLDMSKQVSQTIRPEVGDIILLHGVEGSDGGYSWQAQRETTNIYKQIESTYEPADARPGVVGSNGSRTIKFEVIGEGTGKLVVEHRQSWNKKDAPTGTFTLMFE